MSLLRALDGTTCTAAVANAITTRPMLSFLYPSPRPVSKNTRRSFANTAMSRTPRVPSSNSPHDTWDTFFIQALARAGSCREHQRQIATLREVLPPATTHHRKRRKSTMHGGRKQFHKSTQVKGPFTKKVKQFAEKELRALVDYYGIELDGEPEEEERDKTGLLIWNTGDDHQPWPVKEEAHAAYIGELKELLESEEASHDAIYDCYKRLPAPGVAYLETKTIRTLLHHLSIVERPNSVSTQRFLSILDDMKDANIHINQSEWTTAIHFAGRHLGPLSKELSVQSALLVWWDMEKRAGVKGGTVTLNVLFNVAVTAGRYTLAEVFLKEMQARKLKMHRHFRISMLYYYGVMQNGNGVRRTYQSIVSAGDVVDTVVLNAVISALFRAGEPSAAEHVFERMKRLHAAKQHLRKPPPRNWRENRALGLHLTYEGRRIAQSGDPQQRKELHDSAPIAPDSRTYGLVIRHHATTAGNIDRVQDLLKEMKLNSVPLDGTISIVIMHGFASFGGVRYSSWTLDKLERIWKLYLQNVEEQMQRTFISRFSVIAALRAFRKTADAERTLKAWEEVRAHWEPSAEEKEAVLVELRKLVPEHPAFFSRNNRGL